jgi:hypothetical protein
MQIVVIVIVVVAIAAFVWTKGRGGLRPPVFKLDFENGAITGETGPIPGKIRRELADGARMARATGTLRYYAPGEYWFSDDIDDGHRQRFRNVLTMTFRIPPTPS